MACLPCQKKALERQKAAASAKVVASSYGRTNRSSNVGCNYMYDSLSVLDSDLVRIYKRKGMVGMIGKEVLDKQRQLRRWMSELPLHCPPEADLDNLRIWIADNLKNDNQG